MNMPNWVTNKVVLTGSDDRVKEVINFVKGEDSAFDFNKIFPMPEELNIKSPSTTEVGVYLAAINPKSNVAIDGIDKVTEDELSRLLTMCNKASKFEKYTGSLPSYVTGSNANKKNLEELAKVGLQAVNNLIKYDAFDWYEWRCDNWGTKWNTSNDSVQQIDDNAFMFDTAWATPLEVLMKLSRQFPDIRIDVDFADEYIGHNCGFYYIQNGEGEIGEFEDYNDAVSFAKELWGIKDINEQTIETKSIDHIIKNAESKSKEQLNNSDVTSSLSQEVGR